MSDIVERLRDAARFLDELEDFPELQIRAAEEITRLREENARLRDALKPFADDADCKFATYSNHYLRDAAAAIREGGREG